MNIANVESAIAAAIDADTGTGGLGAGASGRVINGYGFDTVPGTLRLPYVQVSIVAGDEDDTFDKDAIDYEVEFEVISMNDLNPPTSASAVLARLEAVFHRQAITVTGANTTTCRRITSTTQHTNSERHHIERYLVRVEEA